MSPHLICTIAPYNRKVNPGYLGNHPTKIIGRFPIVPCNIRIHGVDEADGSGTNLTYEVPDSKSRGGANGR